MLNIILLLLGYYIFPKIAFIVLFCSVSWNILISVFFYQCVLWPSLFESIAYICTLHYLYVTLDSTEYLIIINWILVNIQFTVLSIHIAFWKSKKNSLNYPLKPRVNLLDLYFLVELNTRVISSVVLCFFKPELSFFVIFFMLISCIENIPFLWRKYIDKNNKRVMENKFFGLYYEENEAVTHWKDKITKILLIVFFIMLQLIIYYIIGPFNLIITI